MTGHAEIAARYAQSESVLAANELTGICHMLMNNPRIQVKGDTAAAHVLYTGLMCDDLRGPPQLVEMGREHDIFAGYMDEKDIKA